MIYFEDWIKEQKGVSQVNPLGYKLLYNGIWSYAQVYITPFEKVVAIKPMYIAEDIGKGAGIPVYKTFPRKSDEELQKLKQ